MLGSLEQLGNLLDAVGLWPMVFDMLGPVCEIGGVLTDVSECLPECYQEIKTHRRSL